jgi:hypothetical protein
MRSPGQRAASRHRAPSAAARVRGYAARMLGSTGREARSADEVRPGPDEAPTSVDGGLADRDGGLAGGGGGPTGPDRVLPDAGGAHGRYRHSQIRAGGSRRTAPRGAGVRISPALRRLVVTPTFAAGLGVSWRVPGGQHVRTVLHFSAPIPGNQCSAGGLSRPATARRDAGPARPGVHITPSVPAGPARSPPSSPVVARLVVASLVVARPVVARPVSASPRIATRAGPRPRPGAAEGRSPA